MDQILYDYKLSPTTWVYLSSLLTIAIYFKFSRLWSIRNLDLLGLIALAPGLLLVNHGGRVEHLGYVWLFLAGGFFLARLLFDPSMVRRPLLEPNLSTGGLTFIGVSLLVFMMVNVITKSVDPSDITAAQQATEILGESPEPAPQNTNAVRGPGYPWLFVLPAISTRTLAQHDLTQSDPSAAAAQQQASLARIARTMTILSHLAVVIGMVLVGVWHYDNVRTGIAAAVLYLLLPYTAQSTGRVDHVLPAALLVWAIVAYRSPLISGMLIGLATGAVYYPLFLLPLWLGFYWQRGVGRFAVGFVATMATLVASLAFMPESSGTFVEHVKQMFGWTSLSTEGVEGFWAFHTASFPYRLSVLTAFAAMCLSFALWPVQKNLGTLMSCSAAVMLGTMFWHADGGGVHLAWHLPLLLLIIFRPNLDDRVAATVLGEGWFTGRRLTLRNWAA